MDPKIYWSVDIHNVWRGTREDIFRDDKQKKKRKKLKTKLKRREDKGKKEEKRKKKKEKEQVTRGHNIVAAGWAGASNPHPHHKPHSIHGHTKRIQNAYFSIF